MDASKGMIEYWTVYAPALAIAVVALIVLWNYLKATLKEHKADRDQWLTSLTALTTAFSASQVQTRAYQEEMQKKIGNALGVADKVLEQLCEHRSATEAQQAHSKKARSQ